MSAPVREGEILAGKYRVERVLAEGGMGVVVAAIHQQLEQRVALKFMLPEQMKDGGVVGRFLREARAAVRLRSEHVARVLDVGTADTGAPYIVMEYLDGSDLADVIAKEKRLSIRDAVTYVLQASEAVAEAHALGIVHRDLKPANLFLTKRPDGTPCVKVLDFGISKVAGAELNMTKTSALLGSPFYMAPEQLLSSKNADVRSDVWALGMVLYELLTGVVAFERETLPELCTAILTMPLPPPRAVRPDLPEGLCEVLERALAKSPEDRFQSLAELATALATFCPTGKDSEKRIHRILGVGPAALSEAPPTRVANAPVTSARIELAHTHAPAAFAATSSIVEDGRAPADSSAGDGDGGTSLPRKTLPRVMITLAVISVVGATAAGISFRSHKTDPRQIAASSTPGGASSGKPEREIPPPPAPTSAAAPEPPITEQRSSAPSSARWAPSPIGAPRGPAPKPRAGVPAPPPSVDESPYGPRK